MAQGDSAKWASKNPSLGDGLKDVKEFLNQLLAFYQDLEPALDAGIQLLKAAAVASLNPIISILNLMLSLIREIIASLQSSGFYLLPIYPNFSLPTYEAIFNTVGGGFAGFENRLITKSVDLVDPNAPVLTGNTGFAGFALTVGVEVPDELVKMVVNIARWFRTGAPFEIKPLVPTRVEARPVNAASYATYTVNSLNGAGGLLSPVATSFSNLISRESAYDSIVISWEQPQDNTRLFPGLPTTLTNTIRDFKTDFIIERSDSQNGKTVIIDVSEVSAYRTANAAQSTVGIPKKSKISVSDPSGGVFRNYSKKIGYEQSSPSYLFNNNRFTYVDNLDLEAGKKYYYRVRSYIGDRPTNYLSEEYKDSGIGTSLIYDPSTDTVKINIPENTKLSAPSPQVIGYIPKNLANDFDPANDTYKAILLAVLLDFDLPRYVNPNNTPIESDLAQLSVGYGSLYDISQEISFCKSNDQSREEFANSVLTKLKLNALRNRIINTMYEDPTFLDLCANNWSNVSSLIDRLITGVNGLVFETSTLHGSIGQGETYPYATIGVSTLQARYDSITKYLSAKAAPMPIPLTVVSYEERFALTNFILLITSKINPSAGHLSWYSTNLGQMLPSVSKFVYEFEQSITSIIKASQDTVKAIEDMIKGVQRRISELEEVLILLNKIIELLSVAVTFSILPIVGSGTNADLVNVIKSAENKPTDFPEGFYVGFMLMFVHPAGQPPASFSTLASIFSGV